METLLTGAMTAVANLCVAGVFITFWLLHRSARWNLHWGIAHAALAIAVLCSVSFSLMPALPLQIAGAVAGSGIAALVFGVLALNGRVVSTSQMLAAVLLLALVLFALIQVDLVAGKLLALVILSGSFIAAGVLLLRRLEVAMRIAGWLLLARGGYFIVYAWLMVHGHEAIAQVIGHFFALSTALGLLFVAFTEHGRRLELAQKDVAARNLALQEREAELIRANQQLADMAVRLEERNLEYVQARDRAQAADRAKTHFLHNMSHELRTPLNAIIGFSELMLAQPNATLRPKADAEKLQHIAAAGRRLLDILSDILEFAGIDLQAVEPEPEMVEVADLLGETLVQLQVAASSKQISMARDIPSGVTVWLDRRLVKKALLNVIGNAIKFTPTGGQVGIATRMLPNQQLQLQVTDSGPGVDDRRRDQMFEPFGQGADVFSHNEGGIGLGLSTARRLVEILGGQIRAEPARPSGTRIIIELPAALPVAEAGAA